ncbi:MAG: hypothetical protein JNM00_02775, partial [Flavobacteriales bacterium]|nr:hypothetical protein [Flavobacteriales bacterium]
FSPAYAGIDLLFSCIPKEHWVVALLLGLVLYVIELSLMRVYIRIFTGLHRRLDKPTVFRSA